MKERMETEKCKAVKELCERDVDFLDQIQLQMATAREFVFILRFRREKPVEIINRINRFEKLLSEQGFEIRRAVKSDIQRITAVYFEQNITHVQFCDFDGGQYSE